MLEKPALTPNYGSVGGLESALQDEKQYSKTKPARIGYYRFEKSLGEGNFAKVKLATHMLLNEKAGLFQQCSLPK